MPREGEAVILAREWLRRARSNLARARQSKPEEAVWEDPCFDAHQAAEKALKAVLVALQVDFPRTHQIAELLSLLGGAGRPAPEELWRAQDLTVYATIARYPRVIEPATENDHRRAVGLAEAVVRWAEEVIGA